MIFSMDLFVVAFLFVFFRYEFLLRLLTFKIIGKNSSDLAFQTAEEVSFYFYSKHMDLFSVCEHLYKNQK